MEKVKSFLKKNLKTLIMTFMITICSFLVVGKVSAEEISLFCEYTNPCISEEIIEEVITTKNIDKTIYDSYFLVIAPNKSLFSFYFYNSTNGFVINKASVTTTKDMTLTFNYTGEYYRYYTTTTNSDGTLKYVNRLLNGELNTSSSAINVMYANGEYIYYSNQDLKDVDGNIVLAKNSIEPIPEEDPNVTNTRIFLEQFKSFSEQIYTLIGSIVTTIIQTPLLMMPFGLCILGVIISVFYKLFSRR